jgi:RNA polymerase sigma-70 factor (ECF subfamily)
MTLMKRAAIVLTHLDALYNLATWLTHDAAEAQALVQATLRQALQMPLKPFPGTKLRLRLLTIMWESYGRQRVANPDGHPPDAGEQASLEKRSLLRTLPRVDLDAALRQLPEGLRATVVLHDMEGYAFEEVAAILGWTRDQVQIALMQARRLLSHGLQARLMSTQVWPAVEGEDSR